MTIFFLSKPDRLNVPCDRCRQRRTHCNLVKPSCGKCEQLNEICSFSYKPEAETNEGSKLIKVPCDRCRGQKLYCDKLKPNCSRCRDLNEACNYTEKPKKIEKPKFKSSIKSKAYNTTCSKATQFIMKNNTMLSLGKRYNDNGSSNHQLTRCNIQGIDMKKATYYYDRINLKLEGYGYTMATNLFKSSVMTPGHKVFVSTSGKIGYFGISPYALLLTMYVAHHHTEPTKPTNILNRSLSDAADKTFNPNEDKNMLPITTYLELNVLHNNSLEDNVRDMAIHAYFQYFHSHQPILLRKNFILNYKRQPNLLKFIVIGIGIGYLPFISKSLRWHYCHLAKLELTKEYTNCNLNTIAALLIMSSFQNNLEDCTLVFQYLGQAIRMSECLGLHLDTPENLDEATKEFRVRLYWMIHITDKMIGFASSSPFSHDYRLATIAKPKFIEADYLETDTNEYKFTALAAAYYYGLLVEICQLKYLIRLKFDFVATIKETELSQLIYFTGQIDQHITKFEIKVLTTFSYLNQAIDWKTKITDRFEHNLRLIYNATLVHIYQTFSKVQLEPIRTQFQLKATLYSRRTIDSALHLGNDLFYYGSAYKFYCLVSAVFYWIKVVSTTNEANDGEKEKLGVLIETYRLINNCKPYYLMAHEASNLLKGLATSENIKLD